LLPAAAEAKEVGAIVGSGAVVVVVVVKEVAVGRTALSKTRARIWYAECENTGF
jgi:hypothetical protein